MPIGSSLKPHHLAQHWAKRRFWSCSLQSGGVHCTLRYPSRLCSMSGGAVNKPSYHACLHGRVTFPYCHLYQWIELCWGCWTWSFYWQKFLLFYINNLSRKDNFWYKYCTIYQEDLAEERNKRPWNDCVLLFWLLSNLEKKLRRLWLHLA